MSFKIRIKLILAFLVMLIPFFIFIIINYSNQRATNESFHKVKEISVEIQTLGNLQLAISKVLMPGNDYIITGDRRYIKEFDRASPDLENMLRSAEENLTRLKFNPDELKDKEEMLKRVSVSWENIKGVSLKIFAIPDPGGSRIAARLMEEMDYKWAYPAVELIGRWREIDRKEYTEAVEAADRAWRHHLIIMAASVAALIFFGISFSLFLSRLFAIPIKKLLEGVEALADGNLDYRLNIPATGDEFEQLIRGFNMMAERLNESVEALHESEGKFKNLSQEFNALLNAIPDTLILISPDMKVLWANDSAAISLGKSTSELTGQLCYHLWHNRNAPCNDCLAKKSFLTGEIENTTVTSSADGRLLDLRAVPIKDAEGKVISVIEVARDITKHRKLETQLQQAQKMEAVGTLTGGIAHDFNNILTAIIGYGNILKMKLEKESPMMGYTDQILASAERAANLTQSLLAFSRKQITNPNPVNLNEIVATIEKILHRVIGENIELRIILSGEIRDLRVMADIGQIEQVLMNLAVNARDAMPEGGTLTIETGISELDANFLNINGYRQPGIYATITITDTGLGMDENTRQRMCEPFFTTKEVGKGTGLGLSMVYGIIKQHSGYINCYSEQGKGTTFRIYLSLIKEEVKEAKAAEAGYTALTGGAETILLAEDEEEVRKLMKLVLEEAGYKVIVAVDGKDAVEKFRENKDRVNLLLLDVIMPKRNGKEVYEEAKKIMPDIKVLFSSGYPADLRHEHGILEEGLNFIAKPALPRELLKMIREAIDK